MPLLVLIPLITEVLKLVVMTLEATPLAQRQAQALMWARGTWPLTSIFLEATGMKREEIEDLRTKLFT